MPGSVQGSGAPSPVFHDPRRWRWRIFKGAAQVLGAVVLVLAVFLVCSVIVQPKLPGLGLPLTHRALRPSRSAPTDRSAAGSPDGTHSKAAGGSFTSGTGRDSPGPKPEVIGFYVSWDETSFSSLKDNIQRLDRLMPEWLHLADARGTFTPDNPTDETRVTAYVRANRPALSIIPLVNNYSPDSGKWDNKTLATMLSDPSARSHAVQQLLSYVSSHDYGGIDIDFENVPSQSQPDLATFMSELYQVFHARGLEVSQCIPLDDTAYNCRALAQYVDYLILMAYDEHSDGSQAGPIASEAWFKKGLEERFSEAPSSKYVLGLGNYGYDWLGQSSSATDLSYQDALRLAHQSHSTVALDPVSLNPTYDYLDSKNQLHHVWFLDGVTVFNQLAEASAFQPRGYALYRLGSEDPSVWKALDRKNVSNTEPEQILGRIPSGNDVDIEGTGEVLRVTSTGFTPGHRAVTFDEKSGLVVGERIVSYPSECVVTKWGGANTHKIALTFDDGPDSTYTPQILDVLERFHAPATFFIIGSAADLHPDLLTRIVNAGDEIGNHTFTHPDVSTISHRQLELELNATERLFESTVGRRSLLFRPPYGEDMEPTTRDQILPLITASRLGYYTIGMQIDPSDWRRPGVDAIINRTLAQAEAGQGNIVLLHDGGGDRSETVAALPTIIEQLRSHGFQLVTISSLLGVSRNAVNPPLSSSQRTAATVFDAGFQLTGGLAGLLPRLFLTGLVLGILWLLALQVLALVDYRRSKRITFSDSYQPSVAVIVPAHNEERVIAATIQSLLLADYPRAEIIVVDDGSTDGTYAQALAASGDDPRVRVVSRPNGGKASALNFGISLTEAEIIVALDADTVFLPDTIGKLARHFENPRVGAVSGNAKVGNRVNVLTKWQALEYITSQNLDRRACGALNCITVVPGAVGAWRRLTMLEAGGFAQDTLAEDADLTLAILRLGYRVSYDEKAIALTEAPETVAGFLRQRFRWTYGTLQALWKHRGAALRPKYRGLGLVGLPQIAIFKVLFPLFGPLMDLAGLGSLALLAWERYEHPLDTTNAGLERLLVFLVLFLVLDFLAAAVALLLEKDEDWRLLGWLLLQRFCYRFLIYQVVTKSVLMAIRGEIVGWGKLQRKGTVNAPPIE